MVPPGGDKKEDACRRGIEHGGDDSNIRQVSAAVIGGVDGIGVTRSDRAYPGRNQALHALTHGTEVDRYMGGIGHQPAFTIKQGTGKIQAFLDIHRVAGLLQGRTHLLGNRHE